jgi:hypothetical protein
MIEKINKFLDTDDLLKFNQENINNLSKSMRSNETETIPKNLPSKQSPGSDGFSVNFLKN